jgi:hypothetical protein
MINPLSLSNNLSKIVSRSPTMTGFVEEHWGEEIDTISFQGSTAAFITGNNSTAISGTNGGATGTSGISTSSPPANMSALKEEAKKFLNQTALYSATGLANVSHMGIRDDSIGLTTSRRRNSVSYRLMKRIVDVMRLNGCVFDQFGLIARRYSIQLSYGGSAYRGFFESLDITEDASAPFRFTYIVTFKSEETAYSYDDALRK